MEHKLHETYRNIEREYWWFVGRRKILFNVLNEYISKGGKILDIGCNSGVLVDILQKSGYDVFGTDSSEEAIGYGTDKGVKNLIVAHGEKQPFADETFDCVLALDVIEHVDDDVSAVAELQRVLRPGGLLVIKVPAFMFLWGLQDEVAHHKRRYTKRSISDLIEPQFFDAVRVTYFNFLLFVPIATSRLLQKVIPPERTSDFDLNGRFINTILKKIFLFEAGLLRFFNFPFGVSLLLLARKK